MDYAAMTVSAQYSLVTGQTGSSGRSMRRFLWSSGLIILFITLYVNRTDGQCVQFIACQCYDSRYIVRCDFAGLTHGPVFSSQVASKIRHLSLRGNSISYINASYMHLFPHLQLIDLRAQNVTVNCTMLVRRLSPVYILTDCKPSVTTKHQPASSSVATASIPYTRASNSSPQTKSCKECITSCLIMCCVYIQTRTACKGLKTKYRGTYSPSNAEQCNARPTRIEDVPLDMTENTSTSI